LFRLFLLIPCWESQRLIPKRSAGPRATKIGVVSLKALDHHRPNREESPRRVLVCHALKPGTVLLREYQFSPPITETHFRDQNKAGHGAVSFGILGANRMAVIAPLLGQLLAHTGVAIHDLSGGRDGRR